MRVIACAVSVCLLCVCICACQRDTKIDPVLFCADFNRRSESIRLSETDAILRSSGEACEVVLFCEPGLIRLQTNETGSIHTAVVTGERSDALCMLVNDTFAVLAAPLSEDVPRTLEKMIRSAQPSVQTEQTKRFQYSVYASDSVVTVVQINLLLSSLPAQPTLRRE